MWTENSTKWETQTETLDFRKQKNLSNGNERISLKFYKQYGHVPGTKSKANKEEGVPMWNE